MPTRNSSYSNSLRADIAVLNPTTGKMEFPNASLVNQRSINSETEKNQWKNLADRVQAQVDGPMFQPDFKITDEVRKDFEELFGSYFQLKTNEWIDENHKNWGKKRGEEVYFKNATDEQIKQYLGDRREDLEKELKTFREHQAREEKEERPLYLLGRDKSSPERRQELDRLREQSEVKEIIYRGQDAYEVLDSKKASEVIKELRKKDRESGGEHYSRGVGYTGSEGDGLFHLSPEGGYAGNYGSDRNKTKGVIEGVLVSKKLLDITSLTASISIYHGLNSDNEYKSVFTKYYGKGTFPPINGYEVGGMKPTYKQREELEQATGRRGIDFERWKWSGAIADTIAQNYQRVNGKPMPANIGLSKTSADKRTLQERFYEDMKGRNGATYQVLKTPTFKSVMKKGGFDAVKYLDYGVGITSPLGTPAYGATKPTQFKSYFGNKKVNQDSPNVFDAD